MRIAYAGAEGAFAHEACRAFAPDCHPVALQSFAAVVGSVGAGECELGMLPLHNSHAGEVHEVTRLLDGARVAVTRRGALPVRMHLLGLPGATLASLEAVTSHPMALRQCARVIAELGLPTRPAANTALAARALRDPGVGVLASESAAAAYGLQILKRDVHDDPDNSTIFAVVQKTS